MADYKKLREAHMKEQEIYWSRLRDQLRILTERYGAAMDELSTGLGVARGSLYDFISEKSEEVDEKTGQAKWKKGLKVNRSDLLNLWAYMTDPFEYRSRKLKPEERDKRQQLREEGPDRILEAVGFLPRDNKDISTRGLNLSRPEVMRVASRLSSGWIEDGALLSYISNDIQNQILDQGRLDKKFYYLEMDDEEEIEEWPRHEPLFSQEEDVLRRYRKGIRKLANTGKTKFVKSELFELYQSILEHVTLNRGSNTKLDITDCQFQTLSKSIYEDYHTSESLRALFIETSKEAEIGIACLLNKSNKFTEIEDTNNSLFAPVIEARISCDLFEHRDSKSIAFRYASTATHVENMLVAIKHGLGYPLIVSGFFVRATGITAKSLARVAISLSPEIPVSKVPDQTDKQSDRIIQFQEVYQGWWVTSNTILGILKSVVDALMRWMLAKKIDPSKYYQVCSEIAAFNHKFYSISQNLYEYLPENEKEYSKDLNDKVEKFSLNDEIEKFSNEVRQYLDKEEEYLSNDHSQRNQLSLKNKINMSRLMRFYIFLISGDIENAKELFQLIEDFENKGLGGDNNDNPYKEILSLYASACIILYRFISGHEQFLLGKQWRTEEKYKLDNCLKRINTYAKLSGAIDFNMYLCASQFFGVVGQVEFYSGRKGDEEGLSKSIKTLLKAAHYSSRISHTRRTAHWLAYASRTCCRLGDKGRAEELVDIAETISRNRDNLIHMPLQASQQWTQVNINLGRGEISLLLHKKYTKALDYFIDALEIALSNSFVRVVPDILYNLYRASSVVENYKIANPFKQTQLNALDHEKLRPIIEIIRKTSLLDNSEDLIFTEASASSYKKAAKEIWHMWAERSGLDEHPFEKYIEEGTFLNLLSESV